MIPTIVIVGIALMWLGYETKWLTIRLEAYSPQNSVKLLACPVKRLGLPAPETRLLLDTLHFEPSNFICQDMPETTGEVNIACKRE